MVGNGLLSLVGGKLQATFSTSSLAVGSHSITAVYIGDSNFQTSKSSAAALSVGKDVSTTALTTGLNPASSGQSVTFTAKIAVTAPGTATPTGTVTFRNGSATLGTGTVQMVGGVAEATYTTSTLSVGRHTITAVYAGTASIAGSTSGTLTETISSSSAVKPATANPLDVNGDGAVTPLDALMIINELDQQNAGATIDPSMLAACDVNGDGVLTALDALLVINYLSAGTAAASAAQTGSVVSPQVSTATGPPSAAVPAAGAAVSQSSGAVSPAGGAGDEALAFAVSAAATTASASTAQRSRDGIFAAYPGSLD